MMLNYFVLFAAIASFSQKIFAVPAVKGLVVVSGVSAALMFLFWCLNGVLQVGYVGFAVKLGVFLGLAYVLVRTSAPQLATIFKGGANWNKFLAMLRQAAKATVATEAR